MKAIIKLDVPEWQIGQDVTVYFPDTMVKHEKCEPMKEQEAIVRCKDCKFHKKNIKGKGYCCGTCDDLGSVDDDWYCADGERKDSDGE